MANRVALYYPSSGGKGRGYRTLSDENSDLIPIPNS